jgi:hypothetical protein
MAQVSLIEIYVFGTEFSTIYGLKFRKSLTLVKTMELRCKVSNRSHSPLSPDDGEKIKVSVYVAKESLLELQHPSGDVESLNFRRPFLFFLI